MASQDPIDGALAERRVDAGEGLRDGTRPDLRFVPVDQDVGDLVEQAQGDDLAGARRRRVAGLVQQGRQTPDRAQVADPEAAVVGDLGRADPQRATRRPPDPPGLHPIRTRRRSATSAMAEGCHVAAPTASL
jgi:hypothetical protein